MRNIQSTFLLAASVFGSFALAGCGAMNDNPTSAEQMHSIRSKEAAGRANFNPTGGPPGAPAAPGAVGGSAASSTTGAGAGK